ncbi:MAG: transposase [Emticicia sp.]|uniref:transposase n=1 Tax=Emticicia sp. TaxID=1930953 RepID=UPI003BA4BF0A
MSTDKFKNKYRIASARASWWNYGWNGAYFITICTKNREHFFGKIENGKMQLSKIGLLADVFWHEIKNHTENTELGAFVVMPNHIHGILILDKPEISNVPTVETGHALSLQTQIQTPAQQRFRNQGKNTVSSIIGSYKSAITKHCNRLKLTDDDGLVFGWQTRFHDHIIRNDEEYQRINDYIETNPANWENDKFYGNELT